MVDSFHLITWKEILYLMLFTIRSIFLFPVFLCYYFSSNNVKKDILDDLAAYAKAFRIELNKSFSNFYYVFCYCFIYSMSFRTIFYYRISRIESLFLRLLWKSENSFSINPNCIIKGGFYAPHAYSTIINAKEIGKNFVCRNCTTIGNKIDGRNDLIPTIGNNVVLGCNVVIIGNIRIGNNVIIGAGTVVVKDVPDNSTVVGSPVKVYEQ